LQNIFKARAGLSLKYQHLGLELNFDLTNKPTILQLSCKPEKPATITACHLHLTATYKTNINTKASRMPISTS